jgi:hypothetical protein
VPPERAIAVRHANSAMPVSTARYVGKLDFRKWHIASSELTLMSAVIWLRTLGV